MLIKEYRVAMPITTEEYRIGQLFMIAKHSHEQSSDGEGVEVVHNVPHSDPVHGEGRYTEKRIHLSNRLPTWVQSIIPRVFYVTEKAWNYYPYTETEYNCSFLPKFNIFIKTKYRDDGGTTENCLDLSEEELKVRVVDHIDIAYDEVAPKHYKEAEDPKFFKSKKTHRGPLVNGWRDSFEPIMCSYKLVNVSFEVWGLQTRVEDYAQKAIRDILLLGHRQAFAWLDDWYGMTEEDVREYEKRMQEETNEKVLKQQQGDTAAVNEKAKKEGENDEEEENESGEAGDDGDGNSKTAKSDEKDAKASPKGSNPTTPVASTGLRSWLTWS